MIAFVPQAIDVNWVRETVIVIKTANQDWYVARTTVKAKSMMPQMTVAKNPVIHHKFFSELKNKVVQCPRQ